MKLILNPQFYFRLLQFVRPTTTSLCNVAILYGNYHKYCEEHDVDPKTEQSFKKTVASLFGVKSTTIRFKQENVAVYKGLEYSPNPPNNSTDFTNLPAGWFKVSAEDSVVCVARKSGIFINDVEILKEVTFYCDGSISIRVRNKSIEPQSLGLPPSLNNSCLPMGDYLQRVSSINICMGKLYEGHGQVQCIVNGEVTNRKFSKSCYNALHILASGDICQRCHSIKQVAPTSDSDIHQQHESASNETPTTHAEESQLPSCDTEPNVDLSFFFPGANETLMQFVIAQSKCSNLAEIGGDSRTRRWPAEVLNLAMSLWITSPVSYRILCKYFFLPSEKLLQLYKNSINKNPGINEDMMTWMYHECDRTNTPKIGGVVFDEMAIQSGIQLQPKGAGLEVIGVVDFGEDGEGIHKQQKSSDKIQLATTALQFVFLGLNGFRFPFAYMLNKGLTCGQLCTIFWDIISTLQTYDFTISFTCMDGASTNRSFVNMICDSSSYLAKNISSARDASIACIMDYSHVIKKIRNSLYASGKSERHKRQVQHKLGHIYWENFVSAFQWDYNNHYCRIHRKLTSEHFELNSSLKMRNHLAEQVLNNDMLLLLKCFQKSLQNPESLDATIDLVSHTAPLVEIFRSHMPITSIHDDRLDELRSILHYLEDWHEFCKEEKGKHKSKQEIFITSECYQDLKSCIQGFISLCHMSVPQHAIIPALVNSDVVENLFCMQRAIYNGPNTHPDAAHYRYILNMHHKLHRLAKPHLYLRSTKCMNYDIILGNTLTIFKMTDMDM